MRALGRVLLSAALLASGAAAAEPEHEVKAAFLFKFLSYIEWPDQAFAGSASPFVIGVMGADDVRVALQEIARGRLAQGRPVEVQQVHERDLPQTIHLLFVGHDAAQEMSNLRHHDGVLVVSDVDDGLDRGAMVNLLRIGDLVRFQVDPAAAEQRGMRISSRMLAVAQLVKPAPP